MTAIGRLILIFCLIFCLGGIPFSWFWAWLFASKLGGKRVDLRKREIFGGSGNVGASNAWRFLQHPKWYVSILIYLGLIACDASKGYLAVELARHYHLSNLLVLAGGLTAIVGHCFPLWLGFKRGKGISTTLGVLLALQLFPEIVIILLAGGTVFAFGGRFKHTISAASLSAAAVLPLIVVWRLDPTLVIIMLLITALVYLRHWDNIVRLWGGTEPPMTLGKFQNLKST